MKWYNLGGVLFFSLTTISLNTMQVPGKRKLTKTDKFSVKKSPTCLNLHALLVSGKAKFKNGNITVENDQITFKKFRPST